MPRAYSVNGSQTVTTPADTILGITTTTAIRPEIFFLLLSCEGTPADNVLVW